jgi:poly(beta-D-mannuronate) lyase
MQWAASRLGFQAALAPAILLTALLTTAPSWAQSVGYLVPPPAKDNVQAKPKYECDGPDALIITLDTQSKYRRDDARRATIDEDAEETYSEAVEPLRDYGKTLARVANAYVKSNPRNTAAAAWPSPGSIIGLRRKP